jgi:hypothetical protein
VYIFDFMTERHLGKKYEKSEKKRRKKVEKREKRDYESNFTSREMSPVGKNMKFEKGAGNKYRFWTIIYTPEIFRLSHACHCQKVRLILNIPGVYIIVRNDIYSPPPFSNFIFFPHSRHQIYTPL